MCLMHLVTTMFSKRGALVWSGIKPLVKLHGEKITTKIVMEVGKTLDSRGVFQNNLYTQEQIDQIAHREFKTRLATLQEDTQC